MPRVFVPAVLSGVLLWAAFFPLDLGFLGWVALVPWLSLVRADVSRRRRYCAAYLGGFTFFVLATQWVRVAHPMMYLSWAGLSLVLPLFWVAGLALIRRLDRLGLPLAVSVPVAWVALEYFRMHFPTGFPFLKAIGMYQMVGFGWYFLGYTQHAFAPLIQIADIGGVYAVSFLVGAVNGSTADWLLRTDAVRRWLRWPASPAASPAREVGGSAPRAAPRARPIPSTAIVAVLLLASVCYGFDQVRTTEINATPSDGPLGPRVAAIQGSVPQFVKNKRGKSLAETYMALHGQALRGTPRPDLIVWPETCCPDDWIDAAPGQTAPEEFVHEARECARVFAAVQFGTPVLLGLNGREWEAGRIWKYNSALLLDVHGKKVARYDKMHLVPFGEYVPFGETLPWMRALSPYPYDYSCRPGEHWTRFPVTTQTGKVFTFACLICYEDSDPYLARQYVANDSVDFFVNISNDGWFNGTEEHEQHLAICRFRAIEARRAVVRSVNMGISAVIDAGGRVVALPGATWGESKKIEAVVSAVVPIDHRGSLYATLGDWVPAGCWLGLLAGLIALRLRRGPGSA